jgi:hypothetical protein
MDSSGLLLTVADLRGRAIVDWEQDVHLSFAYKRGPPMIVKLVPDVTVPKAVFKYQLHQALVEGTANGGVRWWCERSHFSVGQQRQAGFDISVRFMCRHGRSQYKKQASTDGRRSKHTACVDCPAFVRFRGVKPTEDDPSIAVVISFQRIPTHHSQFEHSSSNPLTELRKKFEGLSACVSAEILSSHQLVFLFQNACQADDALLQFIVQEDGSFLFEDNEFGKMRAVQQRRYVFTVWKMNLRHERHVKPSHPAHRGMFVSYEMTQEVANMSAAGATPAAIVNFLTKYGQRGSISAQRVQNIRATIESDLSQFTVVPSTHESACSALLRMLDTRHREKKDLKYIFLYTEPTEHMLRGITDGLEDCIVFDSIRLHTAQGDDAGLSVGDKPEKNSWLSSLIHFFTDRFSALSGSVRVPPSRDKKKSNPWFPNDRIITVRGRKCLLMCIMWCTNAEQVLFAKYPEVAGHDTKAAVCSTALPWFYCIGYRDNMHTYIIFRGLVANETLGMFMFLTHTVWPYLHGRKRLRALRCNISDGKDEQIKALKSMTLPDGLSPDAFNLLCSWHIVNRGMHRIFGSATLDWQRALEKVFWIWQTQETLAAISDVYNWILEVFFNSVIVQSDMSATHQGLFRTFIDNIWSKRGEWSLAHNLELQAFECRVNTFTEANFSVLTERVNVSASMSATTFVRREDLSCLARNNKLAYAAHRDATRAYSHKVATEWTKRFAAAEDLMFPKPLEILKNQVLLGASCARSDRTKNFVCSKDIDKCAFCSKYITIGQKKQMTSDTLRIHLLCYIDEEVTKKVRIADLPYEYVTLLKTIPRHKYWRVVTVIPQLQGVRLLCSCGFGMRFLTCCLHVSLVLQKSSAYTYFGCEPENIHVRHTNLYASVDDMAVIQRTHDDWQGIFCSTLTFDSVEGVFPKNGPEEPTSEELNEQKDPSSREHGHDTRHRDKRRTASAEESAYKAEKIANLKSHMFDVLNIIDSTNVREDIDRFVKLGEDAIFALKRQLPNLPQRSRTTVARRPASEAQKVRRSARRKRTKSKKLEAAAPKSMQRRASLAKNGSVALDATSDYSDSSYSSSTLAGFVHGSDHEEDSQTSYSTDDDFQ